jgi:hypothetical protein
MGTLLFCKLPKLAWRLPELETYRVPLNVTRLSVPCSLARGVGFRNQQMLDSTHLVSDKGKKQRHVAHLCYLDGNLIKVQ